MQGDQSLMSDGQTITCPLCGAMFQSEPEYVTRYAGQATACSRCGGAFRLPGGDDDAMQSDVDVPLAPANVPETYNAELDAVPVIAYQSVPVRRSPPPPRFGPLI